MNAAKLAFSALLGRRLPRHHGSLRVECEARIEIRRDPWGVAYVDAQNEADAWFGLGFCHAQDRAGQLETTLRLVRGTLSQVVGREGLEIDRASRLLGVRHAASAQLSTFDEETRAQLTRYCAGINAAQRARGARRSHEHVLLRCRPSAWEPADVIAFGLMMCCLLPSNWDAELARLLILTRDGASAVESLDPSYPETLPVTYPPGQRAGAPGDWFLSKDLQRLREYMGSAGGSNAWALSGQKTDTGRPLLASDPHLPASLPNLGYLARVKCPGFAIAGVSIVGAPAFLAGHNGHVAWGSTAANVDNTDLFLEELSADGSHVREGQEFVPCARRTEIIEVRGGPSERLEIRTTKRGPIVARAQHPDQSIFDPLPFRGRANALSFAATWLRKAPTRALLSLHKAKDFREFRASCALSTGSAYSLIYADPKQIGWVLAAEVPIRKQGFGSLPMPGWEPGAGWEETVVGSSELPYGEDPASGYVCSANNKLVPDHLSSAFLGHDFLDGYRQERISGELRSRSGWDIAQTARLQLDVQSLAWAEIRGSICALAPTDARAKQALELLSAWDGRVSGDSAAASLFELFMGEMCQRICRAKAPNSWLYASGKGVMKLIVGTTFNARRLSFVSRLLRERPNGYFESWAQTIQDALTETVRTLEREFGTDPEAWAWGKIRPLKVSHRFGEVRPLDRVYGIEALPGYGDGGTVNQAGFEFWKPLRHSTVTAHCRAVIDVGNWSASRFVLLGGQSGNPLSPNYASLIPLWQRGEGVPIYWEDAQVRAHAGQLLTLVAPARKETADS